MKWLFFADTPLQVYHAALIVLDFEKEDSAELMICEQFADARGIGERMAQTGIFEAVHHCAPAEGITEMRRRQMKAYLGRGCKEFKDFQCRKFDFFALTTPTCVNSSLYFSLKTANRDIKAVFYDDGVGSYTGDVFRRLAYLGEIPKGVMAPLRRARLYRAIFTRVPFVDNVFTPAAIYVRQPQLIGYSPSFPIRKITSNGTKNSLLSTVFTKAPAQLPPSGSWVFLDVPRGAAEEPGDDMTIDSAIELSLRLGLRCYIRSHPRSKKTSKWSADCADYSGGLWEILCEAGPMDNLVLVGFGSTAQISPVIGTGSKPILVLLHKLCCDQERQNSRSSCGIETIARTLYGQDSTDRVFCPSTLKEFEEIAIRLGCNINKD